MSGRLSYHKMVVFCLSLFLVSCFENKRLSGDIGSSGKIEVTATNLSVGEGLSGQIQLTFSSEPLTDEVINYSSTVVTATSGSDYTALSGSVTISAHQTSTV